jgi:DNA repair protein RecO (recombination protein O)
MSTEHRINHTPGFILHSYPFKETSVVAEVWTRAHGRVALIARGARRPHSALRGLMQPFTPLLLSWFGKAELKTLHGAEWQGGLIAPQGRALMCGFYLNELLLRLLARDDPHPALYDAYGATLAQLSAAGAGALEAILRRFEKTLLGETGYAATFDRCADSGEPIQRDRAYVYQPEHGAWLADGGGHDGVAVSGQTLLDLAADQFERATTLVEAKVLMRALLNHTLGAKPLYTRQLLRELTELNDTSLAP